MNQYNNTQIFTSTEELRLQTIADHGCQESILWGSDKPLEYVLEHMPFEYRYWGLLRGYVQFEEHCDWSSIPEEKFFYLIKKQPKYANKANWSLFEKRTQDLLIKIHPQLAEYAS